MSGAFLTELFTRVVSDEGDELLRPLIFRSEVLGRLVRVPAGFVTDYASVPRLPFAYLLVGGHAKKAAVIHDWLYRTASASRADADAVFEEAMAATGQPWWRRKLMWLGVRIGGRSSYPDTSKDLK